MSDLEIEFWRRVDPASASECWPWKGAINDYGYGTLGFKRRVFLAHRLSYELNTGPIPDGLIVRHSCDNRPCVNPGHLLVGTHAQNTADMLARGRGVSPPWKPGESHYRAKLTEADVRAIRSRAAAGEPHEVLGAAFGTSRRNVSYIVHRKTWKHV